MRLPLKLVLVLQIVGLHGCTTFGSYSKVEPQLDTWEKSEEFGRSLDALAQIDPTDPDYSTAAKRRKQVEKDAADYEQRIRKETQKKLNKGDWAAALDQYDEALSKHPKSAVIKDGLAKLNLQQQATLEALELDRLIKHGKWLKGVIPIYDDIARVNPRSDEAQARLRRIKGEAADIAAELALIGNKALADNDLKIASETLPLAVELNDDPVTEESLKTLRLREKKLANRQQKIAEEKRRKEQAKKAKRQHQIESLLGQYKQAFAAQNYVSARQHLDALQKLNSRYRGLADMKSSLQAVIDNKVTTLFDQGVSAYSRGLFEEAAQKWRATLELDANHQQAKENLERAEKVLEKIESLKTKQGQ